MIFTTEGLFEVSIESWAEWDLNPRPLNSVQMLWPTELSGYENCFLSFIIFLISNCNFHLSVLFSYRSDVLFSWTVNQFIFQNICRWLLISFFQRTNDSGEWNMQRVSLWHIFSNWYRRTRKIRFKHHLYCQDAGN